MIDLKDTYIELKNLTLCVNAVAAVGNSHVLESTAMPECWVVQLYLFNVNQPIILYYNSEEECLADYYKVNHALINLNKGE
jgi:hypothetical protein